MPESLNHIVSALFGKRWFAFFLIALFIFLAFGVWIFSTPEYETMYNHRTLPPVQTQKATMHCHILELGNTGRKVQESIDISFFTAAYEAVAMKPAARNFGKSDRRAEIRQSDDTTTMRLFEVAPGTRVEIQMVFLYEKDETPYNWNEIFKGVEAVTGKVVAGDPGWTALARLLYAIFG